MRAIAVCVAPREGGSSEGLKDDSHRHSHFEDVDDRDRRCGWEALKESYNGAADSQFYPIKGSPDGTTFAYMKNDLLHLRKSQGR
jgi:hypothetical protein